MDDPDDVLALAWCEFQPRTQNLAESMGGAPYFVKGGRLRGHTSLVPARYIRDAAESWNILRGRRPKVVIAVSPPVFAPLVAWAWCRTHDAALVMDCHTPAFHSAKWGWSLPLHRWLARRADAVTLHSESAEREVAAWGAPAVFVPDDLPEPTEVARPEADARPRVVMAGSLDELEPVEAEIEAARLLPDVDVIFTGDQKRLSGSLVTGAPANASFTGWLPYPRFLEELQAADVVAAFCTDPRAVNRAGFEALGLSRPLVLSELPSVRERFEEAALFCLNEPPAMAATLREAIADRLVLAERSRVLQERLRRDHASGLARLQELLARPGAGPTRRVLMISQHDFPSHPTLRRNVEFLVDQGVEVDVVCTSGHRSPPERPAANLRLYQVHLKHRRFSTAWYPVEYVAFFLRALPRVLRLSMGRRYHAVQVDNLPDFLVLAGLVARLRGARLVFFMFELMPELTASRMGCGEEHPVVRAVRWLEQLAVRCADAVVIVNEPCRRILLDRGVAPDRVTVILNTPRPVPPEHLEPPLAPVMITHATLVERYGVQVGIRALALLRPAWPTLTFEILGSGEHQSHLERLAAELSVGDQVFFRGFVPWAEALSRIRRASVGVVPVLDDGYGHLLLPTKLFDYVAQGVPAAASGLATMEHYFPEGAVSYFEPGDAAALAVRVNELLADPVRAADQAGRARAILKTISWEQVSVAYLTALGLESASGLARKSL